jgi:NDP-sugar pyrophosphorylase family protein
LYGSIASDPDWCFRGRSLAQLYMTDLLQILIDRGTHVQGVGISGGWLEVDTLDDLSVYEKQFAAGELQTVLLP